VCVCGGGGEEAGGKGVCNRYSSSKLGPASAAACSADTNDACY